SPDSTTFFHLIANDTICGLKDTSTITVSVSNNPRIELMNDTSICTGSQLQLNANTNAQVHYWQPPEGLSDTSSLTPLVLDLFNAINYEFIARNKEGCLSKDSVLIEVNDELCEVFIPNVITPNSDGENDVFKVSHKGLKRLKIAIYNRWGQKVGKIDSP
ncbi:MAG: gliding motility-associated C-terminal domain-containing protein, partial [Flavobacteriales bacterium]